MFYLLSLLTGILECGWIAFGALHAFPLWKMLCFPLAYHFGNLFPKPFSLNRACLRIFCAAAFLTGILSGILPAVLPAPVGESMRFPLTCAALFLISASLQSVRDGMKSDVSRLRKRVFRVAGFALAPWAAFIPTVLLILSSIVAMYALSSYEGGFRFTRMKSPGGFNTVMLFHQLHYFFYAHAALASASILLTRSGSVFAYGGIVIAAFMFCGTWITYLSVEPIVTRFTKRSRTVFYAGHTGIALLLAAMIFAWGTPAFPILWIVTGFCGGTVYTIKETAKEERCFDQDDMTLAENTGHTLGLLTSVCAAAWFGEFSLRLLLALGSVSALCAVLTMIRIRKGGS